LSALLAVIYIIVGTVAGGAEDGFKVFAFVILPLACIWFGDAMGGYCDGVSSRYRQRLRLLVAPCRC
jgi:hypothetical protein